MRHLSLLFALFLVSGCQDADPILSTPQGQAEAQDASEFVAIVAPLIDPAKLDTLKGKRAATPRLRKACYWLEMAKRDGHDLGTVIDQAHALTGPHEPERIKAQKDSLIRNLTILERLGCLDDEGMAKLRKENSARAIRLNIPPDPTLPIRKKVIREPPLLFLFKRMVFHL